MSKHALRVLNVGVSGLRFRIRGCLRPTPSSNRWEWRTTARWRADFNSTHRFPRRPRAPSGSANAIARHDLLVHGQTLPSERGNGVPTVSRRHPAPGQIQSLGSVLRHRRGGLHRLWKATLVDTLRPRPAMRILDVAGGTGDIAFRMMRAMGGATACRAAGGTITVADINAAMLALGAQRASQNGLGDALTFVKIGRAHV